MLLSKRSLFVVIVLALLIAPAGVLAQDGASQLVFTKLQDGETITSDLTRSAGANLYVFDGSEGDVVTVSMTQITEDLDPLLVLLGPAGEVIAADDDSGDVFLSSLIESVTLPQSGSYFIMATSFQFVDDIIDVESDNEVFEYELSLSGNTLPKGMPDYDPEQFLFMAGTVEYGETTQGVSSEQEPVFYYLFQGAAGDVVNLTLQSDDFDTILHVFDSEGTRIAVNDDDGVSLNSAVMGLVLPTDGMYMIFATDVFFYNVYDPESPLQYTGGEFTLTLERAK